MLGQAPLRRQLLPRRNRASLNVLADAKVQVLVQRALLALGEILGKHGSQSGLAKMPGHVEVARPYRADPNQPRQSGLMEFI